jgi:hypothetical protein
MVEVVFESLARMTSHEVRFSISSYVSCSRRSLSVIRLVVDLNPAGGRSMSWCFTVVCPMPCQCAALLAASVSMSRLNCGAYTAQQDIEFRMPRIGPPLLLPVQTWIAATKLGV